MMQNLDISFVFANFTSWVYLKCPFGFRTNAEASEDAGYDDDGSRSLGLLGRCFLLAL